MASAIWLPRKPGSPAATRSAERDSASNPNSGPLGPPGATAASKRTSWAGFSRIAGLSFQYLSFSRSACPRAVMVRSPKRDNRLSRFGLQSKFYLVRMNTERNLRRTVLPNGLIVLTERMEHVHSVAMGIWIKSGSRCETPEMNGISHFVEHMLFKGTRSRTAQRIAREMDSIGGNLDAFTSKETICFNVKSLSDHVPIALDVLSDMVLNPIFALPDIERERGVILEEIKIDEDNPDVLVHELFTQSFWKGH